MINDEAASTGSLLVHLYVYGRWTEVRIRNDDEAFGPWQPFTSTLAWSLADVEGLRTVRVEMRRGSTVVDGQRHGRALPQPPMKVCFMRTRTLTGTPSFLPGSYFHRLISGSTASSTPPPRSTRMSVTRPSSVTT